MRPDVVCAVSAGDPDPSRIPAEKIAVDRGPRTDYNVGLRCMIGQADRRGEAMEPETSTVRRSDRELVVTRVFSAPPERLYEAWTRPELLK
jgi:hypothetical protein